MIQQQVRKLSKRYDANLSTVRLLVENIGAVDAQEILRMHPNDLRSTIRVNLLKTNRQALSHILNKLDIKTVPIDEVPEGLEILSGGETLGHSIPYMHGLCSPQGIGSMLTVDILDPKPHETILDMAAAPGNKSCFIAERMNNTGILVANDISQKRLKSVRDNLTRHGIQNTKITNLDGVNISTSIKFDKILLDAPCTGEGLIVSQPKRRKSRTEMDPLILQRTQQRLFNKSLGLLKKDGILVYSTCSLNNIENEEVIAPFTSKFQAEKFQILKSLNPLYSKEFPTAIRLLPNRSTCDGFFIMKVRKL